MMPGLLLAALAASALPGIAESASPCDTTSLRVPSTTVLFSTTVSRFSVTTTSASGGNSTCVEWCAKLGDDDDDRMCMCWFWWVLLLLALLLCCLCCIIGFCCPRKTIQMKQVQKIVYVDEPVEVVSYACGGPGACGTGGAYQTGGAARTVAHTTR